jgi:hypothetical protein
MMQTATPENPDAIPDVNATASPPATVERRFAAVVNFTGPERVGDCMLELNIKGYIYTNGVLYTKFEPIGEGEHVVSGTISGAVKIAAEDSADKERVIDAVFELVGQLVEPYGGECTECRLADQQASPRTEDATELSTTYTRNRQGSPFAAELDRRLAGDEPLPGIVLWWWKEYQAWRALQPLDAEGWGPSVLDPPTTRTPCTVSPAPGSSHQSPKI